MHWMMIHQLSSLFWEPQGWVCHLLTRDSEMTIRIQWVYLCKELYEPFLDNGGGLLLWASLGEQLQSWVFESLEVVSLEFPLQVPGCHEPSGSSCQSLPQLEPVLQQDWSLFETDIWIQDFFDMQCLLHHCLTNQALHCNKFFSILIGTARWGPVLHAL